MRLNDITVNKVGVLHDIRLADIPGLSVIYGGNGSGKSTLVRFLMDTLIEAENTGAAASAETPLGTITVTDDDHRWDVTRYETHDARTYSRISWQDSAGWSDSPRSRFPSWVTEEVFREIFCPGYSEADRFELLFRLCLESGGTVVDDAEVHRTERAIQRATEERDGTHSMPGINQQIGDLQRQRDQIRRELTNLKRHDPSIPREIASIEAHVVALRTGNKEIDREIAQLQTRIAELEQHISRLLQRNVLPLNADQIRAELSELIERRDRWAAIQTSIERELGRNGQRTTLSPARSGRSIRAIVDRLEKRLQEQHSDDRLLSNERLTMEVAALCNFVNQQQDATTSHENHLEAELTTLTAEFTRRIESVLQTRIDILQEELGRSENVLEGVHHRNMHQCESAWHRNARFSDSTADETIESLRLELHNLQERIRALQSEQDRNLNEVQQLSLQLEELRRQLTDFVSLESIDALQARVAELQARIELLQSQFKVLTRTEAALREVLARLRERRHPGVLEMAAPWIRQLTEGECTGFIADATRSRLLVTTTTSPTPLRIDQLSRGTQHQAALVLRLALLQVRSTDSDRMPLIIDDVFVTSDDTRGALAADLLRTVGSQGQQILLLTCQNDVRGLMTARGAHMYDLTHVPVENSAPLLSIPAARVIPASPQPEPVATYAYEDYSPEREDFPLAADEDVFDDDDSHWLFYLEPEHPVSDLSGLELSELRALEETTIETVDDLISASSLDMEHAIRDAGFHMTEDRLIELQTQARMAICVPMLRQRDAELLVSAGIDNVRQLARLRPEAIHELVVRFQNSDSGNRYLRSGHSIDQQQAISWNRWALHARTLDRARLRSSRRRSRRTGGEQLSDASSSRSGLRIRSRRDRIRTSGQTSRQSVRPQMSEEGRRRRDNRILRRRQQRDGNGRISTKTPRSESQQQKAELRFYLNRSSNVEAAPSIGPKTATRFAKVGIVTVDDLLACNPDTIATLLDNSHISADVIRKWQNQARLVCTIPQLRGHDAQILVACGQTDPDEISSQSPDSLYSVVKPYCDTGEGERIVRGGRKPDLKEIKDWISWAQQSRPLKVA